MTQGHLPRISTYSAKFKPICMNITIRNFHYRQLEISFFTGPMMKFKWYINSKYLEKSLHVVYKIIFTLQSVIYNCSLDFHNQDLLIFFYLLLNNWHKKKDHIRDIVILSFRLSSHLSICSPCKSQLLNWLWLFFRCQLLLMTTLTISNSYSQNETP